MKLLSINSRGLGNPAKRREIRQLISSENVDVCFFQETKLPLIDQQFCRSLWHSDCFDWAFKSLIGRSGGILCIWDVNCFQKSAISEENGYLLLEGFWGQDKVPCCLVNVYASCLRSERRILWDSLKNLISAKKGCWLLGGDFNTVKCREEKMGIHFDSGSMSDFANFINDAQLVDLQLGGRKYTWYKTNGKAMSRLDRFLFSQGMANLLGNCTQTGLKRKFSVQEHGKPIE